MFGVPTNLSMKKTFLIWAALVAILTIACKKSNNGTNPGKPPFTFTGFSPSHGFEGDTITLSGSGFQGSDSVLFNGTLAGTLMNVSSGSMQVLVPAGASSGPIEVVHNGFSASGGTNFTVDQLISAGATVTHLVDIPAYPTNGGSGIRMLYGANALFITGPGTNQDAVYKVDLTTNGVSPYIKLPAGSLATAIAAYNGADTSWMLVSAESVPSGNNYLYDWRFGNLTNSSSNQHVYFNSLKFNPALADFIGADFSNKLYHIGITTYGGNTSSTDQDTLINSQLVGIPNQANAMVGVGPNGKIVVFANHALYQLQSDNSLKVVAGQPGVAGYLDGQGSTALFQDGGYARGNAIAIDASDNVYVADYGSGCIRKVDNMGNVTTVCGNIKNRNAYTGPGDKMAFFFDSWDICFGADYKTLYVISRNNSNNSAMPNAVYKVALP